MADRITNKATLRELAAQLDRQSGIEPDLTATAQKARAMMREQGVRAEDNNAFRELMHMRYGGECEEE